MHERVGEILYDQPMSKRSSGTVVPSSQFSGEISRQIIVVQPAVDCPRGPYRLQPDPNEGQVIASFKLHESSLLVFTATAYAPKPVTASATMFMIPACSFSTSRVSC